MQAIRIHERRTYIKNNLNCRVGLYSLYLMISNSILFQELRLELTYNTNIPIIIIIYYQNIKY